MKSIGDLSAHDLSDVGGIYVDFSKLELNGNFSEDALCNGSLARALRRVAAACDIAADQKDDLAYIDLDEGKMFAGSKDRKDCVNCMDCTNCSGCKHSDDCSYCNDCEYCEGCTDCNACSWCYSCTNCVDCSNCSGLIGCIGWRDNKPPA